MGAIYSGTVWLPTRSPAGELKMNRTLQIAFVFVGIVIGLPALAGEANQVKCPAGQDHVWVYDSLTSLGVQTKVKCGDRVEIIAREKGFVKIRTQDGTEGYVPEDALPKPPAPTSNSNSTEKPAADNSLAAQARAYRAAHAAAAAPAPAEVALAPVAAMRSEKAAESRTRVPQAQPQISSAQPAVVSSISIEPYSSPQPGASAPVADAAASSEAARAPASVP